MKFGKYLLSVRVAVWKDSYLDYHAIKQAAKKIAAHSFGAEQMFLNLLTAEMKKASAFYTHMSEELSRRLQEEPSRAHCEVIGSEIIQLSQFASVNQEAVRKSLKRHDRFSATKLSPTMLLQISSFCPSDPLDSLLCQLSTALEASFPLAVPTTSTVRPLTRVLCWIKLSDVPAVVYRILSHLPISHKNIPASKMTSAASSVYFDTPDFYCYRTWMKEGDDAASIRVRWYGSSNPTPEVFIERKNNIASRVEGSSKTRFSLASSDVMRFFQTPAQTQKTPAAPGDLLGYEPGAGDSLMNQIQRFVAEHPVRPVVATKYRRATFQLPAGDSVHITLDTDILMIREQVDWTQAWYAPEESLKETDLHRFPYAVLEVRLPQQESERPAWVRDLLAWDKLRVVPNFSKFGHACAVLYRKDIPFVPDWFHGREAEFTPEVEHLPEPPTPASPGDRVTRLAVGPEDSAEGCAPNWASLPVVGGFFPAPFVRQQETGRMKIEPKTYFANERTYLQWFGAGSTLASLGVALMNMDSVPVVAGLSLIPVALGLLLYALRTYQWRLHNIHMRKSEGYHDPWGPSMLTLLLAGSVAVAAIFTILGRPADVS